MIHLVYQTSKQHTMATNTLITLGIIGAVGYGAYYAWEKKKKQQAIDISTGKTKPKKSGFFGGSAGLTPGWTHKVDETGDYMYNIYTGQRLDL